MSEDEQGIRALGLIGFSGACTLAVLYNVLPRHGRYPAVLLIRRTCVLP